MSGTRVARLLGWVVSLACLAWFLKQIQVSGLATPGHGLVENLLLVGVGGVAYGLAVTLLALLWADLVLFRWRGRDERRRTLLSAYLIGQFAKYLPGNVFQFAARHGLGRRAGVGHGVLASAAVAEVYLLLCAGLALGLGLGMPIVRILAPEWPKLPAALGLLPALAAFALCLRTHIRCIPEWVPAYRTSQIALGLGGYLLFFLIFGGLYALCLIWSTQAEPDVFPAIGTAAVAWVAGFVLPGAPAGAGLREMALSLGNHGLQLTSEEALAAIVLFRTMTLVGDFLAFLAGWQSRSRIQSLDG